MNAIIDSYIAKAIMDLIYKHNYSRKEFSKEINFRINCFYEISKKLPTSDVFLLGVAFTQYYGNAYMDVVYPKLIENSLPFVFSNKVKTCLKKEFQKIANNKIGLKIFNSNFLKFLKIWKTAYFNFKKDKIEKIENIMLKTFKIKPSKKIHNKKNLKLNNKYTFLLGFFLVQKLNSIYNKYVYSSYYKNNKKKKIQYILSGSKNFQHKNSFIKGALKTQIAASNWDDFFRTISKILLGSIYKEKYLNDFIKKEVNNFNSKLKQKLNDQ
jgi:hypothetical protein